VNTSLIEFSNAGCISSKNILEFEFNILLVAGPEKKSN